MIVILKEEGNTVAAYQTDDFEESMGVNDRIALAKANEIMRKRINQMHMVNGVSFVDSATTYIDAGVDEYYLTDIIEILKEEGNTVAAYQTDDFEESMGVSDRIALAKANEIMRKRINQLHLVNGVSFVDSAPTYIDAGVEIGPDTLIEAGVQIQGKTVLGSDCVIGSH